MNELRQPDRIQAVVLAVGAALSLGALGFFLASSLHLDRSDAFDYLAVSDGSHESGTLANWIADPPEALRTPQNGVAGVFTLLSLLGFGSGFSANWKFGSPGLCVGPLDLRCLCGMC